MRTTLKSLCLFVLGLNLVNALPGAMTVKQYKTMMASSDKSQVNMARLYITGVASGITAANAQAEASLKGSLFCQPRSLALNTDNLVQTMEQYLAKNI